MKGYSAIAGCCVVNGDTAPSGQLTPRSGELKLARRIADVAHQRQVMKKEDHVIAFMKNATEALLRTYKHVLGNGS